MTETPSAIVELLKKGTDANNTDPYRQGNVIVLPNAGSLIVTGDLHGHWRNFERIVNYADLAANPSRHLVLQEIIHGGKEDQHGGCMSFELLIEAARLKVQFPHRVHLIMGNHDTAFICDTEVMKAGKEMNGAMRLAMKRHYGDNYSAVERAFKQFLFSQPLALKCANRIWISHSLCGNREIETFDEHIFTRPLQLSDLTRNNSGYTLTWGRKHNEATLDRMSKMLDVDIFVLGHQAQPEGCSMAGNLIILACDHNHGCLLPIDLSKSYSASELFGSIVPLASLL